MVIYSVFLTKARALLDTKIQTPHYLTILYSEAINDIYESYRFYKKKRKKHF